MKALSLPKHNKICDLGHMNAGLHSDGFNGFLNSMSAGTDHSLEHYWLLNG